MKLLKLAPLLVMSACAVGPDFKAPQADLSTRFVGGDSQSDGKVAARAWWTEYRDPMLTRLVGIGMKQNLDEIAAKERIREAEAELRQTGVNAAVDGNLTADRQKVGGPSIRSGYSTDATLSASFVIDLFGGIRRQRESAQAGLAAARADVQTERLAWLAELIADYSNARYYQQAMALTRKSIQTRVETVKITNQQLQAGGSTEFELADAQALLETARADLPNYTALFNSNVFAMAELLNVPAGPLLAQMQKGAAPLRTPGHVATGVPADLLRNRPDIRYYEAELHAAVANVGVAEADLYPSLQLTGDITDTAGTKSWGFGPSLTLPLLNQGLLRAQRDAKISLARQAEITWRQQVVSAVNDVQTAQSNLHQYRLQAAALSRAAASYSKALDLGQQNYRSGATTLLDLLDTDRDSATAQISAASAVNQAAQEWATLQIATGAGAGY